MNSVIENLNKPLRKCIYAGVFFILAILILFGLKLFNAKGFKLSIIPIILSFLYACTDEFHQMFVSGRASEWLDVMIDTVGAIIGVIVINIIFKIVHRTKEKAE